MTRLLRILLALGLAMAASPFVAGGAVAQTTSGEEAVLGFFDVTAETVGIGAAIGDPTAQPNPVAAGLVPNAVAQLGAGPSGRALSSIAWPGPLLGNAGSLANVVGTPLPPEVVANGNYPVKAEAGAGAGARDEDTVGPMSALVDGGQALARTALTDFAAPGLVSAARITTRSRTFLEEGLPVAEAETLLQDVEVGGIVKIATVRTLARGRTDGSQATTEQETVLTGVTVQGQPATIDGEGLKLGPQAAPSPLTGVAEGAAPAIAPLGMRAFVTQPAEQSSDGGASAVRSGAVVLEWKLGDSGQVVTVTLGGSAVVVGATPGTALDSGSFGGPAGGGSFDVAGGGSLDTSALLPSDSFVAGGGSLPGMGATGGSGPATGGVDSPVDLNLAAAVSDRVPWGWMLVGALGMLLVGSSLHGLRLQALAATAAGSTCPLERRPL